MLGFSNKQKDPKRVQVLSYYDISHECLQKVDLFKFSVVNYQKID